MTNRTDNDLIVKYIIHLIFVLKEKLQGNLAAVVRNRLQA